MRKAPTREAEEVRMAFFEDGERLPLPLYSWARAIGRRYAEKRGGDTDDASSVAILAAASWWAKHAATCPHPDRYRRVLSNIHTHLLYETEEREHADLDALSVAERSDTSFLDWAERLTDRIAARTMIASLLSMRQRDVIENRYVRGETLLVSGERLGVCAQRAQQIERRAISALKSRFEEGG